MPRNIYYVHKSKWSKHGGRSLSFDWNNMAFFDDGGSKSVCKYKNGITSGPVWDELY